MPAEATQNVNAFPRVMYPKPRFAALEAERCETTFVSQTPGVLMQLGPLN